MVLIASLVLSPCFLCEFYLLFFQIHTILILGFGKAVIFVETPAVKEVSQIIETKHKCLTIGESGIGKSMLLHHIALQLLNKEEYSIVPCSRIKDILNHYKKDVGQLLVIDDICGPFTLSVRDTERLLKYSSL